MSQEFSALERDLRHKMEVSLEHAKKEFSGLRTGRASTGLLEPVMVEAYGSHVPLNQVASISVPEPRLLSVSVWDKGMSRAVEKAIRDSNLGLNPVTDGTLIRVPIPPLTSERRAELTKIAHKYAEHGRVAIRNVRREGNEALKKMEKDSSLSKDEHHRFADQIQKMTDDFVAQVDEALKSKEAEITQV
ncbi:MAG: ribosome recycling factor [Candidatus Marinimicrobia bacterium]|nr:ribosome recycling factor [Candidatus Neomarinimicrobiota bacterium]